MSRFVFEKKIGSVELGEPKEIIARLIQYHDQKEKTLDLRLYINGDFCRFTRAGLTIPVGLLPAFFDFIDGIKTSLNETIQKGVKKTNVRAILGRESSKCGNSRQSDKR